MDVVNGNIAETARAPRKERMVRGGVTDRRNTADHHHQMWSGLRPSRGLFARTLPETVLVQQQQGPEISADSAPPTLVCNDTTKNTSPLQVEASVAPGAPSRWNYQPQQQGVWERDGRAEAAAQDLTELLDCHRQGWNRTKGQGLQALGPKPSRSPLPDTSIECDQLPESPARAAPADWEPTWTSLWESSYEPLSSLFGAAPGDGALAAPPTRPVSDAARRCWNWSQLGLPSSSTELSSPRQRSLHQRHRRFNSSPCLDSKLDEEMAMFELQLTRTLSGYLSNRTSVTRRSPEIPPEAKETSAPVVTDAGDDVESKKPSEFVMGVSSVLKRKRADFPDGDVQGESRWTQPLKLLVRKELTLSDVGELGRIVLPKKDAESLSFPQIDTKDGTLLEMEDYVASKRWYCRFKYWLNNKSRMYVLENTGDFIRYHCLKERDVFIIFEDVFKKLVVRGLKLESDDPVLELSKGSIVESSTSQAPSRTTEDESCCNVISSISSTDTVTVCS